MHENITIGMPHGYFGSTKKTQSISISSRRRALVIFSIKVQEVKYIHGIINIEMTYGCFWSNN